MKVFNELLWNVCVCAWLEAKCLEGNDSLFGFEGIDIFSDDSTLDSHKSRDTSTHCFDCRASAHGNGEGQRKEGTEIKTIGSRCFT